MKVLVQTWNSIETKALTLNLFTQCRVFIGTNTTLNFFSCLFSDVLQNKHTRVIKDGDETLYHSKPYQIKTNLIT